MDNHAQPASSLLSHPGSVGRAAALDAAEIRAMHVKREIDRRHRLRVVCNLDERSRPVEVLLVQIANLVICPRPVSSYGSVRPIARSPRAAKSSHTRAGSIGMSGSFS